MRNLTLPDAEFQKEVKVVMEERRLRTEDKPTSLTYEEFTASAYKTSPYHNPVIGWMNDLENMTAQDLKSWYRQWYAPNNATLVVVGDVDPAQTLKLAKKYFAPLKPSTFKKLKPQKEVPQKGERRVIVKAPAEVPYLIMGYHVPVLKTSEEEWEPYALEMLAAVLDGGNSARFAKELVRGQQIAVQAGASYDLYSRMDSLFLLDGTPSQGNSIRAVEAALREQVKRIHDKPVEQAELDRIKAQVVASKVYELDSVFYQGMQIGTLETVGLDWRKLDEYVERIKAVTPEQIQKVARKYLIDDHLTVAELDPQPQEKGARKPVNGGGASHAIR
jgi:zinc protease